MRPKTAPLLMVFSDPADLDAFIAAVEDHADAPHLVLRVAQRRALAALHASGAAHITPDDLPFQATHKGLDVVQDALVELAYRCGQREPMTAAEIARLRVAALTACAWQEYTDAEGRRSNRKRLVDQLPDAIAARRRKAKEARDKALDGVGLLQREADRLCKLHPELFKKDLRAMLAKFPGANARMIRAVKITRRRKNLPRP